MFPCRITGKGDDGSSRAGFQYVQQHLQFVSLFLKKKGQKFSHPLLASVPEKVKGQDVEQFVNTVLQLRSKSGAAELNLSLINEQVGKCSTYSIKPPF